MTTRSARPDAMGGDHRGRPRLHLIGERVVVGAALAALGLCCASSLLGFAVVSGAVGAIAAVVAGPGWFAVALVVAGSGTAVWLGVRRRPKP